MIDRSIEIYYDINRIEEISGDPVRALDFRNAAMMHIESAMEKAGAGHWSGAESGGDEVNFGFEVEDFDAAEAVVREAVTETPFANIREIKRIEIDLSQYI